MTPKTYNFTETKHLKNIIRHPYSLSYDNFLIMSDCDCICNKCAKSEFKNILHSTLFDYKDFWHVKAIDCIANYDCELICARCNTVILEGYYAQVN